jgi:hypothetical protein
MPRFSVVIPTRNRRRLLERTLESVLSQRLRPAEIIVVDDDSSDGTAEFLATLANEVRSLVVQCGSPGAARNAGARIATGDYLVFLDSDDLWLPWTLATFGRAIESHHSPAFVAASFREITDEGDLRGEHDGELQADAYDDYLSTWPRQLIIAAGMVAVRRDQFQRIGGFAANPINLEDHDLTLRLGDARGFVQVSSPLMLGWRCHRNRVSRDLERSVAGCAMLIETEKRGGYPGGVGRSSERRGIITTHARSVSIECAKHGLTRHAARIYAQTLRWHLSSGRWKYMMTFPFVIAAASLKPRTA